MPYITLSFIKPTIKSEIYKNNDDVEIDGLWDRLWDELSLQGDGSEMSLLMWQKKMKIGPEMGSGEESPRLMPLLPQYIKNRNIWNDTGLMHN